MNLGEANFNAKLFLILPTIQFRRVGHNFTSRTRGLLRGIVRGLVSVVWLGEGVG